MNNPPRHAPPAYHLCFSGSPTCSGCNPCGACDSVRIDRVLTGVMRLDGHLLEVAHRLHEVLTRLSNHPTLAPEMVRMGFHPAQLGIRLPTPSEQCDLLFRAYFESAANLSNEMLTEPLRSHVIATPCAPPPVQDPPSVEAPPEGQNPYADFSAGFVMPTMTESQPETGSAVLGSIYTAAGVPDPIRTRVEDAKRRASERQTEMAERARARRAAEAPVTSADIAESIKVKDAEPPHANGKS